MKKTFKEKSTSGNLLEKRISANQNSTKNFDEWSLNIMPQIPLRANILDLGAGTGKQIKLFSNFTSKKTVFYALDFSSESLNAFKTVYEGEQEVAIITDDFLNFPKHISKNIKFDLVYSFYALYYTNELEKLLKLIYKYLKKDSPIWVVGPYKGTNKELFSLIEEIYPIDKKVKYSIDTFYKDLISYSDKIGFKNVKVNNFENKISFNNYNELLDYTKNTTFFDNAYEKEISKKIKLFFKKNKKFILTKEIISIQLYK